MSKSEIKRLSHQMQPMEIAAEWERLREQVAEANELHLAAVSGQMQLQAKLDEANAKITRLNTLHERAVADIVEYMNEIDDLRRRIDSAPIERIRLHSFHTNTDHGITMQDRYFSTIENRIHDENFDHDACLVVTGDFESCAQKHDYTKMICGVLNSYWTEPG